VVKVFETTANSLNTRRFTVYDFFFNNIPKRTMAENISTFQRLGYNQFIKSESPG